MANETTWDDLAETKWTDVTPPEQAVVELADSFDEEHERVLDVGCGPGRHLVYLQKQGFSTIGFDISLPALRNARRNLEKEGPSAPLIQADLKHLPFKDGAFTAEIAVKAVQHGMWADVRAMLAEMARTTRRHGSVLIIAPSDRDRLRESGRELEPNTYVDIDRPDGKVPHHFLSEDEIRDAFAGWSFTRFDHEVGESRFDPGKPSSDWIVVAKKQ